MNNVIQKYYDPYDQPNFPLEIYQRMVGEGWSHLVEILWRVCQRYNISILQVKEKYGGLRFYVGGAPLFFHNLVSIIEDESFRVCEYCGEEGKESVVWGWIQTTCEDCHKKRLEHTVWNTEGKK